MTRIVVEGCGHGTLDAIYRAAQQRYRHIDLLIICGDFQAVRHPQDLNCLNVPPKYRQLGDFHEYYSGAKKAPMLTMFIGGNHEASNHLHELHYGGWAAPNIFFLGKAGVVKFRGLRIGGMSGIYHDDFRFCRPHFERVPYTPQSIRSAYLCREIDFLQLWLCGGKFDIFLSHDWPQGVEKYGDLDRLLAHKRHFRRDVEKGELGSVPANILMRELAPKRWYSGHLHCYYYAEIDHYKEQKRLAEAWEEQRGKKAESEGAERGNTESAGNEDEIDLEIDDIDVGIEKTEDSAPREPIVDVEAFRDRKTVFEAIDKCLPKRRFLTDVQLKPEVCGSDNPVGTETSSGNSDSKSVKTRNSPKSPKSPKSPQSPKESRKRRLSNDVPAPSELEFDPDWLAAVRTCDKYFVYSLEEKPEQPIPPVYRFLRKYYYGGHPDDGTISEDEFIELRAKLRRDFVKERQWVEENVVKPGKLNIPMLFSKDAVFTGNSRQTPPEHRNANTDYFVNLLGLKNKIYPENH